MPLHDPDEDERQGLIARLLQGFKDTGSQIATGAGLLDRGMRFVGENPLDFLPGTGEAMALQDARESFGKGNVGMGLLAAAGAIPGVPRMGGLFKHLEGLKGLRVFARAESPGVRRVVSVTPNTKPGEKAIRATILEETAGADPVVRGHVQFDSMEEAVDALSGGKRTGAAARADIGGFSEVRVGPENVMEGRFERVAETGLFPQSATDATQARARAEARRAGSVGGFLP